MLFGAAGFDPESIGDFTQAQVLSYLEQMTPPRPASQPQPAQQTTPGNTKRFVNTRRKNRGSGKQ